MNTSAMPGTARLPATELLALLRGGQLSATELLDGHLEAIERYNPKVNAIVTVAAEQARVAALESDRRLARGDARALEGLPVVIKDTVPTAGVRTTFGSALFADNVPDADGLLVTRLRAAGAVVIGKSNVPEFAAGSHTFNEIFGVTRNPYDLTKSAGGSSGGAAAALACGMAALADGSDMGGSLRNPASFCNVVGFRPTPGRVPVWPVADPWDTLATAGPMGRTVADATLLLSVIGGPDDRAPLSAGAGNIDPPLRADVRGLRIAWSRDLGGLPVADPVRDVLARARTVLEGLGCEVVDAEPDLSGVDEAFRPWRAWSYHLAWGHLLDAHHDTIKPEVISELQSGRMLTGPQLAAAQRARVALLVRAVEFLRAFDVLAAPTVQLLPFSAEKRWPQQVAGRQMADYIDWMRSCWQLTPLGWPAVSVPAGFSPDGLPVGLQLAGHPGADLRVLQLAQAYEEATEHWRAVPTLMPNPGSNDPQREARWPGDA